MVLFVLLLKINKLIYFSILSDISIIKKKIILLGVYQCLHALTCYTHKERERSVDMQNSYVVERHLSQ